MAGQKISSRKSEVNEIRLKQAAKMASQDMPISLNESTDTMKMLLHASISSLSWVRSLFADKYFETRIFDPKAALQTYANYLNSPSIEHDLQRSSRRAGTPMRHLCRSKGKTADVFLDQLELGAFDAIEKGYLKALQLRIFEDESRPNCILETYTFTIEYDKPKNIAIVSKVEINGHGRPGFAISAVKKACNSFLRALLDYTNNLPHLPDVRFLEMYLIFNESCPAKYQPRGFESTIPDHLSYPHDRDWALTTQDIQGFKTGHHSMDFVISHLTHAVDADAITDQIPSMLPHVIQCSAWQDILTLEEVETTNFDLEDITPGDSFCTQDLLRKTLEDGSKPRADRGFPKVRNAAETAIDVRLDSKNGDFSFADLPTNCPPDLNLTYIQEDKLPEDQIPRIRHDEKSQRMKLMESQGKLWYSQKTMKEVRRASKKCRSTKITRKAKRHTVVRCSCNQNEEDDQMIACYQCHTWQHAGCYGYIDASDTRLPEQHICYLCLLRGKERSLLNKLERLAFDRKAIETLLAGGWRDPMDLSEKLGCSVKMAKEIASKFRQSGYLIGKQNLPAGTAKSDLLEAINPDVQTQERLFAEYFDPTREISHHLQKQGSIGCDQKVSEESGDAHVHGQGRRSQTHFNQPKTPLQPSKMQKEIELPPKLLEAPDLSQQLNINVMDKENVLPPGNQLLYDKYKSNIIHEQSTRKPYWTGNEAKTAALEDIVFETPGARKQSIAISNKRALADEGDMSQDEASDLPGRPPKRMRASRAKNYLRVTTSS